VPVEFSNDFLACFDSHNDSDSIIWDPRADLPETFVQRHPEPQLLEQLEEVSEARNGVPSDEARPADHRKPDSPPPIQTVTVVCKASTTITANSSSASTSSSVPGSSGPKRDGRDDEVSEEAVVSDAEDQEEAVPAPEAYGRAKAKLPVQKHPAPHAPPARASSPRRGGQVRREMSFSSIQMVLEGRRGASHGPAASREDSPSRCKISENEDDSDAMTEVSYYGAGDHGDDTYSFIGKDYSFGADRSLVSWCP
jgi:hypothetical protein